MSCQLSCSPDGNQIELDESKPSSGGQHELIKIKQSLKQDSTGFGITHLGDDGVLRTLSADRDVDAIPLPPRLIKAFVDRFPFDQQIEDKYRGVDGTKVPQQQWFYPNKSLLPKPLPEEERRKMLKSIGENGEVIAPNEGRTEKRESTDCGIVVRANYNLEQESESQQNPVRHIVQE